MPFYSTKRFGPISTGHRQWKDNSHCAFAHGYGRTVKIIFGANSLDERGWVVNFSRQGPLKGVKEFLEEQWDHRLLLAHDDPLVDEFKALQEQGGVDVNVLPEEYGPGIELSCKMVYDFVDAQVKAETNGRCWVESVEIWEHENNSAMYIREKSACGCNCK